MPKDLKKKRRSKTPYQIAAIHYARDIKLKGKENVLQPNGSMLPAQNSSSKEVVMGLKRELKNTMKREERGKRKIRDLKNALSDDRKKMKVMEGEQAHLQKAMERKDEILKEAVERKDGYIDQLRSNLATTQKAKEAAVKCHVRSVKTLEKERVQHLRKKDATQPFSLKEKGVYTPQARALFRTLAGEHRIKECNIGPVIQELGRFFKHEVKENIGSRVLKNVVYEGNIAADIQLGYEMNQSKGT
jgi:hypothetical protein